LLAITETAATAIKSLTASQEQPDEAGVRIAARETADVDTLDSLKLSVVDGRPRTTRSSTSTAPTSSSRRTRRHTSTTNSWTPTSTASRSASRSATSANRHRRPPRITDASLRAGATSTFAPLQPALGGIAVALAAGALTVRSCR
jgi:hypothetical protein